MSKSPSEEKRLWVRLTKACNNRCLFCLDYESQDGSCIELSLVQSELMKGRNENIRRAVLSGGEPSLHPKFHEIVRFANKIGYSHIQVITNGRMFAYKNFLKDAIDAGLKEITFSIHECEGKPHDRITQVAGSYSQSLAGLINALKSPRLIVSQDIVVNKLNVRRLATIIKFFIRMGVSEFDLLQIVPFGRAWNNRRILFYNIEKELPYLKKAFDLSKNKNLHIFTNRFPAQYFEGYENLIQSPEKLYYEVKGRKAEFEQYFKSNTTLKCKGARCGYCFMKSFCNDLALFKRDGIVKPKSIPFCIKGSEFLQAKFESRAIANNGNAIDIFDFLDFFIKNRYFVKGPRCALCAFTSTCDGMQCGFIRSNGYNVLVPIPKKPFKNYFASFEVPSPCKKGCIFCSRSIGNKKNKEPAVKPHRVKADLAYIHNNLKIDKLRIGGNEPLNYPGVLRILKYAKALGYGEIRLSTSGEKLNDFNFTRKFSASGVDKVQLSIYGYNDDSHDFITGTPGSFKILVNAIRNLQKFPRIEIMLHSLLLKQNYLYITKIYDFIASHFRLFPINFCMVRPRNNDQRDYFEFAPKFSEIAKMLNRNKIMSHAKIRIPYCVLPRFYLKNILSGYTAGELRLPGNFYEHNPFVKISMNRIIFCNEGTYTEDAISFLPECSECKLNNFCMGIPDLYLKLYGNGEFKPLTSLP
ncbi:MAG: radical SAM protein [Candidatus Omnitrophota bacterium]